MSASLNPVTQEVFADFFKRHSIPLSDEVVLGTKEMHALLIDAREISYLLWLFVIQALLHPNKGGLSTNFVDIKEAFEMYTFFVKGALNAHQRNPITGKLSAQAG